MIISGEKIGCEKAKSEVVQYIEEIQKLKSNWNRIRLPNAPNKTTQNQNY